MSDPVDNLEPPTLLPDLSGRVAVVTGGGRGIGEAVVRGLAAVGAHVVVTARSVDQIREVAHRVTRAGGSAEAVRCDIADESSVVELFAEVDHRHGRLDVVVNNAGVGLFGLLEEMEAEAFDRVMTVNARGTFLCCREAVRMMKPTRSGTIVNISSVVGFKGYPRQSAYSASKHAVAGLTKALAAEVHESGIRVCMVSPGGVDTEMVRSARPDLDTSQLLRPEDVSSAVLYLLGLGEHAAVDEIYLRRRGSSPF